jgi:hypothetical protein
MHGPSESVQRRAVQPLEKQQVELQVLATCFCLLSSKNPPTIINTASAIVRQAVALVFERAADLPSEGTQSQPGHLAANRSSAEHHVLTFQNPGDRTPPRSPLPPFRSQRLSRGNEGSASAGDASLAPSTRTSSITALMALHELCLMCRGHSSEALDCRPLSVAFVLDIICEVLRTNVELFRERRQFLDILQEDVYGALHFVLKAQLEAETEFVKVSCWH